MLLCLFKHIHGIFWPLRGAVVFLYLFSWTTISLRICLGHTVCSRGLEFRAGLGFSGGMPPNANKNKSYKRLGQPHAREIYVAMSQSLNVHHFHLVGCQPSLAITSMGSGSLVRVQSMIRYNMLCDLMHLRM